VQMRGYADVQMNSHSSRLPRFARNDKKE
jgi:hypothetical protein